MNKIKYIAILLAILLQGCVSYHNKVSDWNEVAENSSFVYGALYIRTTDSASGLGAGVEIYSRDTSKVYNLEFDHEYKVTLTSIPPGNYSISKVIFTSRVGKKKAETNISDINFTIAAGEAVYLGDVIASADYASGQSAFGYHSNSGWKLDAVLNKYEKTTKQVIRLYPEFGQIQTSNISKYWRAI